MPKRTSTRGSELFIVDNSDEDWKALRYLTIDEIIRETNDDQHTLADIFDELEKFKSAHDDRLEALAKLLKSAPVLKKHKVLIFSEYMPPRVT